MIKAIAIGAALISISAILPASINASNAPDLALHETVIPSLPSADYTENTNSASSINDALETRLTAGLYDAAFDQNFPDGTDLVVRMTYANYDFNPVWTPTSVEDLKDLCSVERNASEFCNAETVSEISDVRFVTGTDAERADADVALTHIFLDHAASHHIEAYTSGKWVARDTGPSEPILVASLREAGKYGISDALNILNPVEMSSSNMEIQTISASSSENLP
ncbi:hypothetical protein N9W89_11820 [Hellea sp.]|nr:hypothetical protein [Hellea sp.]